MSNVHGLFSNRKNDDDSDDDRDNNNRFVGGIDSRGGGRYESTAAGDWGVLFFLFFHTKQK